MIFKEKNINSMYKDLVSHMPKKQEFDQSNCIFQKLQFSFQTLFYENDMAKLT